MSSHCMWQRLLLKSKIIPSTNIFTSYCTDSSKINKIDLYLIPRKFAGFNKAHSVTTATDNARRDFAKLDNILSEQCELRRNGQSVWLNINDVTVSDFLKKIELLIANSNGNIRDVKNVSFDSMKEYHDRLSLWQVDANRQSNMQIKCAGSNLLRMHIKNNDNFAILDTVINQQLQLNIIYPSSSKSFYAYCHDSVVVDTMIDERKQLLAKLRPMEVDHSFIQYQTARRLSILGWMGLGYMGFQFGFLFQLIWITYSWDIMEPVTYFVTFANTMVAFAFVLLTKRESEYAKMTEYLQLKLYHQLIESKAFPLERFNFLKRKLAEIDSKLEMLSE